MASERKRPDDEFDHIQLPAFVEKWLPAEGSRPSAPPQSAERAPLGDATPNAESLDDDAVADEARTPAGAPQRRMFRGFGMTGIYIVGSIGLFVVQHFFGGSGQ